MSIVKVQNLGLVLIVVNGSAGRAKDASDYLMSFPGNTVEFVDDDFLALLWLSRPDHAYKFVIFADKRGQIIPSEVARRDIIQNLVLVA